MDPQPFDSSRISSYFRELAETPKPAISSSTLPDELRRACGPWITVTAAAAKASFSLAGLNAAGPVVDLVVALSGVGDAQTELLKSIKADTRLLRQEPLQTAATMIGEAKRVGPSDERWTQFLTDATKSLYRAKSLAASSEEEAVVYFGLACAWLTLNKPADARHWIGESVKSERKVLDAFLRRYQRIIDPQEALDYEKMLKLVTLMQEPLADEPDSRARIKIQASRKQVETFQRFLPFANAAEISAATICARSEIEIMTLLNTQRGEYALFKETFTLPALRSPDT